VICDLLFDLKDMGYNCPNDHSFMAEAYQNRDLGFTPLEPDSKTKKANVAVFTTDSKSHKGREQNEIDWAIRESLKTNFKQDDDDLRMAMAISQIDFQNSCSEGEEHKIATERNEKSDVFSSKKNVSSIKTNETEGLVLDLNRKQIDETKVKNLSENDDYIFALTLESTMRVLTEEENLILAIHNSIRAK